MLAKDLTIDALFELASDAASAQAGLQLARNQKLSDLRISADGARLTAVCAGSDPRDAYQVCVDLAKADSGGYVRCACPSLKSPCKHALGLLAAYLERPGTFVEDVVLPWEAQPEELPAAVVRKRQPVAPSAVPQPTFDALTAGFLQTIRESPDDDAPRLVYSDWLEEHGDLPRAEFIRLQIELAKLRREDPGYDQAQRRVEQLLKKHRTAWLAPLPMWLKRMQPVFQRGFVEEVTVSAHLLLKYATALFAAASIRTIHLEVVAAQSQSVGVHASALAGSPFLANIEALDLGPSPRALASKLKKLLHTPFLKNLHTLMLNGLPVAHHYLDSVTTAYLTRLRRLELRDAELGPAAMSQLAAWPGLRQLVWLDLRGNRLGAEGARQLAGSPHLSSEVVVAVSQEIGPAGQAALRKPLADRLQVESAGTPGR